MKSKDEFKNKGSKQKNSSDAFLIESLKNVVDGISKTFGPRCEVVLHDLRNLDNLDRSIVKIANGQITGRKVGGPITDKGLKIIRDGMDEDLLINYSSQTKDGKKLKSSSIMFRDDQAKLVASLCINFDVTDIVAFNSAINEIFLISDGENEPEESFQIDTISTLSTIANELIAKTGKSVQAMRKADKIEIIKKLDEKGFFLIKQSIQLIAKKLNVSKYTIYNYLDEIRTQNSGQK